MKRRKGFTLVELLVVIAVIALLMAILMPVLRRAQDQAMRILCGNHEKNVLLACTMFADTHANLLPAAGGYWPWDIDRDIVRDLLRNMGVDVDSLTYNTPQDNPGGISAAFAPVPLPGAVGGGINNGDWFPIQYADHFYCPANKEQSRYRKTMWNYGGYIVSGYTMLWYGQRINDNGKRPIYAAVKPEEFTPEFIDTAKRWVNRTDIPQASEAELIVDATLSSFSNDRIKYPYGNFLKVAGGGNGTDSSSHLNTDAKASGGNMGFVDGHVEWRSFTDMRARWRYGGGNPYFWW
jgi:prepilin-type N-terminal cleavage/methylation domain-containing protein/prepilin-type processing-associated H-X9-DG protein